MCEQKFRLTYPWDTNRYRPETVFALELGKGAFFLRVTVREKNPRRCEFPDFAAFSGLWPQPANC